MNNFKRANEFSNDVLCTFCEHWKIALVTCCMLNIIIICKYWILEIPNVQSKARMDNVPHTIILELIHRNMHRKEMIHELEQYQRSWLER